MGAIDSKTANLLSYLTFIWIADTGVVGGLLVVNERSRPIEFHCTAPIPQSRIHEILYGATYEDALFADQLGAALFSKVSEATSASMGLVVTDEPRAAGVRRHVSTPLALLLSPDETTEQEQDQKQDLSRESDVAPIKPAALRLEQAANGLLRQEWSFEKGDRSFTNASEFPDDQACIRDRLTATDGDWDLAEPFQRIRSAIEEAQRAAA